MLQGCTDVQTKVPHGWMPFFSISSMRQNGEPPSERLIHLHPLSQVSHLSPSLRAWSLHKLHCMCLWCAWPCWLDFPACPWTCPCDRGCAQWQLGAEPASVPGPALFAVFWDCVLAGGAIVLPCHQWLLSGFPSGAAAAPWPPMHGNFVTHPISSCSVTRPCLLKFCFYGSIIIFAVLCVSFLGWLHLLKEGTATSACHVYHCPYVMDLESSKIKFFSFLIIAIIQFSCWALSQCFPRTVRNDSNILPQVVIASFSPSLLLYTDFIFFPPMCISLH